MSLKLKSKRQPEPEPKSKGARSKFKKPKVLQEEDSWDEADSDFESRIRGKDVVDLTHEIPFSMRSIKDTPDLLFEDSVVFQLWHDQLMPHLPSVLTNCVLEYLRPPVLDYLDSFWESLPMDTIPEDDDVDMVVSQVNTAAIDKFTKQRAEHRSIPTIHSKMLVRDFRNGLKASPTFRKWTDWNRKTIRTASSSLGFHLIPSERKLWSDIWNREWRCAVPTIYNELFDLSSNPKGHDLRRYFLNTQIYDWFNTDPVLVVIPSKRFYRRLLPKMSIVAGGICFTDKLSVKMVPILAEWNMFFERPKASLPTFTATLTKKRGKDKENYSLAVTAQDTMDVINILCNNEDCQDMSSSGVVRIGHISIPSRFLINAGIFKTESQ